tara:strand:- start:903 stop:1334 length:432 start_codon:yes stop_codon:yes gene_type:complete
MPKPQITLKLPFPPSVNQLWRAIPNRGMILSRAGRKYRDEAIYWIKEQSKRINPLGGRLEVLLEVYPPDRRKRDVSNIPKAVEDAITKAEIIWVDDEQIDDLRIIRREVRKPACVVVHIRQLPKTFNMDDRTCEDMGWKSCDR